MFAGLAGSLITRVTGLPVTSSSSEVAPCCCARCAAMFVHRFAAQDKTGSARSDCIALLVCGGLCAACFFPVRARPHCHAASFTVCCACCRGTSSSFPLRAYGLVGFVHSSVYRPDETVIGLMRAIARRRLVGACFRLQFGFAGPGSSLVLQVRAITC